MSNPVGATVNSGKIPAAVAPSLPASVLVIDHEALDRRSLATLLQEEGYEVVTAASGQEGVELLCGRRFEVAIADLNLPGMDGVPTIAALKDIDPDIEVIILTRIATVESATAALRQGARDFLQKPIDVAQFRPALLRALASRSPDAALPLHEVRRSALAKRALEALRASEEQFRQLAENIHEVFFVGAPDPPRLTYISPAYEEIWGRPCQEIYEGADAWIDSILPEDRGAAIGLFAQAYQGKQSEAEYRVLRPDGSVRDIHGRTFPLFDGEGRFYRLVGIAEDITERRQAERATRESEAKLQTIFNGVKTGIMVIDPETRCIVDANPVALELVGASRDRVVGSVCHKFVCPADKGRCPVVDLGQVVDESERVLLTATGEKRNIIKTVRPVEIGGRKLLLESFVDITARKQAEQALSEAEGHFRSLFASIPLPTFFFDVETLQYLEVNEAAVAYTGYSRDELLKMGVLDLQPPEIAPHVTGRSGGLWTQRHHHFEGRHRLKNGQIVEVEVDVQALDFQGRRSALAVIQDVTSRKRADAEMAERHRLATLVADVGVALTRAENLHQGLQQCAEILVRNLGVVCARVWTVNLEEHVLDLQASAGRDREFGGRHARVPIGKFRIGRIAESGEPHWTNSVSQDSWGGDSEWECQEGMAAFAGYPLKVEERVLGVIAAFGGQPLTEATLQAFASVADNIAQFIKRKRAELALRESEDRYRDLVENSLALIGTHDSQGKILNLNHAAARFLEAPNAKELAGCSLTDYVPPNLLPQFAEYLKTILQEGRAEGLMVLATPSGKRKIVRYRNTLRRRDPDEPIVRWTGQDVTERIQAERAQAFLASLVESSQDAIIGKTLKGIIVSWNHGAEELYGYRAAEVVGKLISILIPPDRVQELEPLLEQVRLGRQISGYETARVRKDGSRVDVSLTLSPVYDAERTITGVVTIVRNITERRRAEQQTRLQTAALESAANGVTIVSREGLILWVNPAFTRLTGYAASEVMGKNPRVLKGGMHDGAFYQELWTTILSGGVWHGEIINRRKDGTLYTEEMTVTPVLDGRGAISHFIAIKQDITERKRAEQELAFKTTLLEAASETTLDGILVVDPVGHVLQINRRFAEIWNLSEDLANAGDDKKILRYVLSQVKNPGAFLERVDYLYAHRSEQTREEVEFQDGRVFDRYSSPLQDARNNYYGRIWYFRDITERKRAEAELMKYAEDLEVSQAAQEQHAQELARLVEELAQERDLMETVMDNVPDYIYYKDRQGRFLRTNPANARALGLSDPHQAVGKTDMDFFPEEDAKEYFRDEQRAIETGQPLIGRIEKVRQPDGQYRWFSTSKVPIRDTQGRVTGLVGIGRDITEHMQAEDMLRASEERYRELFENASDIVYTTAMDTRLTSLNRVGQRFLGYSEQEATQLSLQQLVAPKDWERVKSARERLMAGASDIVMEVEIAAKDGHPVMLEVKPRLIFKGGKPVGVQGIARDITGRDTAEMELRHAQKLESVGRLAAGIAHEINTPIQFVGDNTRFLQDSFGGLQTLLTKYRQFRTAADAGAVSPELLAEIRSVEEESDIAYLLEEIPKALAQTLDGVTRVATIVRAMKEFAHPEGKEMAAADLNRALLSTLTVARNELKYVADVKTDFGDLPLVVCCIGDLNQVFLNLLVNAAHAIGEVIQGTGGKGEIRVRTWREEDAVTIAIRDTGGGIPEAIHGRIFDPFFTTKEVGRGTGQGLAIARSVVVDRHRGALTFESEVGKGTTFFVRLPLDLAEHSQETKPS